MSLLATFLVQANKFLAYVTFMLVLGEIANKLVNKIPNDMFYVICDIYMLYL